ncbi:probable protein phosphatase 2C 14 [Impatiens glandulifera]|uniref:probable protein phosphatase 2C 14 n=1 Tax=Impatiens glandulifera TaxID=253017 RepID=UPI001FB0C9D0|nr:probable protein phosphatase 2C 14 [Impatiens glandulifera]
MTSLCSLPVPSSTMPTANGHESAESSVEQNQMGSSLKRKRPPSLQIPAVLREIASDCTKTPRFGGFGSEKEEPVRFCRPGVGLVSIKGKKKFMEDAHTIVVSNSSCDIKNFFGVYDGHGGRKAVDFAAENLHRNIMDRLDNCEGNESKEGAVKAGYLKTDEDFLKQGLGSGVCCVTALIEDDKLVISNVGDCRAVLSINGIAEAVTKDHRAGDEDERKRIEDKGGYLVFHKGAWRVHGILAVSRSIGDAHLKDWVIAEPDTKTLALTPQKDYLILGSDGLWEEVGNQEAIDIVRSSCLKEKFVPTTTMRKVLSVKKKKNKNKGRSISFEFEEDKENGGEMETNSLPPPSKIRKIEKTTVSSGVLNACNRLVNLAVTRGSLDDITVMVIDLNHFKKQ